MKDSVRTKTRQIELGSKRQRHRLKPQQELPNSGLSRMKETVGAVAETETTAGIIQQWSEPHEGDPGGSGRD
jgi:hypothetical protein